ncbi:amino acid ABC transporter permease [Tenggerimyces flavus]|uniref:Amino acid ABC transporter permease n=1 Tax=Tenggerimyces flavus TaxID=1708749 RepID=A0ABV7Y5S1_9ACTN|nr:amino acid ABC transporter permease [Tenggerimyces flavus]MBM7790655.1 polar amino acid transport system permease protein [Tenggerimyces flavus]
MTAPAPAPERERPEAIRAVPVRHPWRWVAAGVIAILALMFVHMVLTNKAFQWGFMLENAFAGPVLEGARATILLTVGAMIIGIVLGVGIAIMRLSDNPILSGVAWTYVWFFRAVPRVVLLVLFGNLGILYARFEFGFPFDFLIADLFNIDFSGRLFGFDARTVLTGFTAAVLGLALSEAAYMAEIVRAGMQSIAPGQTDAAESLGMSRALTLRRIILPQAMRVIIPPTGNETIAMLKDTALVAYVPAYELWFQLQGIGSRTFQVFPMLIAGCLWYLALTSILMVVQYFIEKRFSRGSRTEGAKLRLARGGAGGA